MRRVVLDTNILVSALWSQQGNPFRIVEMFFENEITLYYNHEIIEEYYEVLHRDKLCFPKNQVFKLLYEIVKTGIIVETSECSVPFFDESDKKFYITAKESNAELITGNKKHYPDESFILTPYEFLRQNR